ncbi:MAG: hypothetical protein IKP06_04080 [Elusimicrobiaceae bacterium]|nr:hypothetical protein [Elusimicrobiaceae bacterium]
MKTGLFVLLLGLVGGGLCHAQEGKVLWGVAKTAGMTQTVGRKAANLYATTRLVFPLEFVNLPQVLTNAPAVPAQLVIQPDEAQKLSIGPDVQLVQAEFFPSRQLTRHMKEFDDLELYSSLSLVGPAFYRGMVLADLSGLKEVLTKGLQWKKTSYNRIFASRYLAVALDHAYVNPGQLPALIQIPETDHLKFNNVMDGDNWTVTFGRDIPADALSRVMVFLKINGHPGWYDVKWQEDKIVLFPGTPIKEH